MKILLVCNNRNLIEETINYYQEKGKKINENSILFRLHNIEILETGAGGFRVSQRITETITKDRFNLTLKLSESYGLRENIEVGEVLNVIRDFPATDGELLENDFTDLYDQQLFNIEEPPHQLGGLVNKTNSYMNIFLPYKKVFGITASISSKNEMLRKIRINKYKPHIETADGLYFSYPCLLKRISFYHLAAVTENLVTGKKNAPLATTELNTQLIDIIQKL
ncbi:MAG: hypothetical protein KF706_08365 [Chitinophagales bacterium]|nr:hypothetical protein [Chitinophagales bacterium]